MRLGIDASNIRSGGGVTHLVEMLRAAVPAAHGFTQVVVWSSRATLSRLDERPWLVKRHVPMLERNYLLRGLWQCNRLGALAKAERCDLLFVPGGSFATDFRPVVTMSRNMLPFEWREMRRYGLSILLIKMLMLRFAQRHSFRKADGLIFLTQYAHDSVLKIVGKRLGDDAVIPHGIDQRFFSLPRAQRCLDEFTDVAPCRILYVSHVEQYKHQWNVVEAISELKACGFNIKLELVGPKGNASGRLTKTLNLVDPAGNFVIYRGAVPYEELHDLYNSADINIYASSCENMPNIVLESMASGVPIACSKYGPMPEVLGDAGIYFDPEEPVQIADAVRTLMESQKLRTKMAQEAFERAQKFSWQRCAEETFAFLAKVSQVQPKE